ncbi:phosphate ABC transporter permease subunit PstC [Pasteurella bettyae]|nr:phosphate ABC transporter permease subunit PstC [Pasteurella bettyae]SUB21343.1 phosphate transport system permease protein PstC [Pasteurella bettyae]
MKGQYFKFGVHFFTFLSVCILFTLVAFLFTESSTFFSQNRLSDFLWNTDWDVSSEPFSFGIFYILLANFLVAFLACIISSVIAFGVTLFICFYAKTKYQKLLIKLIKILAGIPSIIYGFFALFVIVKLLENVLSISSGESLLAGSFILSIMILPFFTSHMIESMELVKKQYQQDSDALGISIEFFIQKVVFPTCLKASVAGFILAFSRAIGETMATMMAIGNTPLFPYLLSKIQTIPSLIALEMGTSEVGSQHYYALIASGSTLFCIVFILNIILFQLERKNGK